LAAKFAAISIQGNYWQLANRVVSNVVVDDSFLHTVAPEMMLDEPLAGPEGLRKRCIIGINGQHQPQGGRGVPFQPRAKSQALDLLDVTNPFYPTKLGEGSEAF